MMLSAVAEISVLVAADSRTSLGLGDTGLILSILLIILLFLKILIASSRWNSTRVQKVFDSALVPLFVVFVINMALIIMEIL